ncbi:glycosyltransferase [Corynebacterium sp. HMSC29G08]|uniref:glycosyltransferase n=1 Tax=Corynebacterium sp. HMSC29G08 TaxID=1581069 RepID=UPI0008A1F77B|nr:glycosyltransferase [Corynebacterium sp. HMSC29G08]
MNSSFPSISVIVASYRGVERLPRLLESLDAQTLDRNEWEVLFVCNGLDDGTVRLLEEWQEDSTVITRVLSTPDTGAGLARNLGLAASRGRFITFVDDDDWIEPHYLEVGLRHSSDNSVVLLEIKDETDGELDEANALNVRRRLLEGTNVPLASTAWVLGFNACKLVPAGVMKCWRYKEALTSGEDVAFFANLLRYPGLTLEIPKNEDAAAYVRTIRADSVSRPARGFDFNVAQRLDVIASLQDIPVPEDALAARKSLESSQFQFVTDWLRDHEGDVSAAAKHGLSVGAADLDWKRAHSQKARRLVFSYCFPPFADPAANVVAKRIAQREEVVDVISGDMSAVRAVDPSTSLLVDPWIQNHYVVSGYPSFSSWPAIAAFGRKAAKRAAQGDYATVYSRALWSGSHVAGALYKIKKPHVTWEAEFSDPMRWGVRGEPRLGGPASGRIARRLRKSIEAAGWGAELRNSVDDHFALTELVTLCLADEVIFTNRNQLEVILGPYSAEFAEAVRAKATIQPQPLPPQEAYIAKVRDLGLALEKLNLAYFGNFYANRGLSDFAEAVNALPQDMYSKIVLHVFAAEANDPVLQQLVETGNAVVHNALNYLEFLAACKQFDILVVVDAATRGTGYPVNPFLPSKLSDYLGAGTPIWAMVEPGSTLAETSVDFVSELGNSRDAAQQLVQMVKSRG